MLSVKRKKKALYSDNTYLKLTRSINDLINVPACKCGKNRVHSFVQKKPHCSSTKTSSSPSLSMNACGRYPFGVISSIN